MLNKIAFGNKTIQRMQTFDCFSWFRHGETLVKDSECSRHSLQRSQRWKWTKILQHHQCKL